MKRLVGVCMINWHIVWSVASRVGSKTPVRVPTRRLLHPMLLTSLSPRSPPPLPFDSSFSSYFEEEASFCIPVYLCFFLNFFFWRWILNTCMANFKMMTNLIVNGSVRGSLFFTVAKAEVLVTPSVSDRVWNANFNTHRHLLSFCSFNTIVQTWYSVA